MLFRRAHFLWHPTLATLRKPTSAGLLAGSNSTVRAFPKEGEGLSCQYLGFQRPATPVIFWAASTLNIILVISGRPASMPMSSPEVNKPIRPLSSTALILPQHLSPAPTLVPDSLALELLCRICSS